MKSSKVGQIIVPPCTSKIIKVFIIYKVVKYRKILLIYIVYFIFSLVKIQSLIFSLHRNVHINFLGYL